MMTVKTLETKAYLVDFEEFGNFILVPHSNELWEIHTNLFKPAFGASKEFGDLLLRYVWENTKVSKLFTMIPKHNSLARNLAVKCGLTFECTIKDSYMHNNTLTDQDIYSIRRQ